jgi:predicted enzyme related to lactoylglutathione lyase
MPVFIRIYVAPQKLEETISFYERLFSKSCERRFAIPPLGVELAQIANFLVVAGSADALARIRHVQATVLVDSLDAQRAQLESMGASVLSPPRNVPTGRNMTVQHPDGLVVEYVEPRRDV